MEHLHRLAQPSARFDGDTGEADLITRRAIADVRDHTGYIRALVALCTTRLLMPVVASGDETMHQDPDREADLAAVTITDGTDTALLAFTGIDSLKTWQADARPILCHLDELAATVEPAGANQLVVDVAGPVPFVLAGEALRLVAEGFRAVEFEGEDFAWVKYGEPSDDLVEDGE